MQLSDDYIQDAMIADAIGFAEDAGYRAQVCPQCDENCGWHKPGDNVECDECGEKFVALDYSFETDAADGSITIIPVKPDYPAYNTDYMLARGFGEPD